MPISPLFRALIGRVLFVFAISLCFGPGAFCASGTGSQASVDLLSPQAPEVAPKKYPLTVWVNVPHYKNCTESISVNPYMTDLPEPLKPYGFNESPYNRTRDALVTQAFAAPVNERRPYPPQGWRFDYALKAAIRESGAGRPHTMVTMYPWIDTIYPYLRKYLARSNEAEQARFDRLAQFRRDYAEKHNDIETDAMKAGLYPVECKMQIYHLSLRRADVMLPKGNYWVTGSHKVIGLKYYWEEPITIDENGPRSIELNEANAILIDGGAW